MKTIFALLCLTPGLPAQRREVGAGINFFTREKEIAMGAGVAAELRKRSTVIENAFLSEYVDGLSRKLAAHLPSADGYTFSLALTFDSGINSTEEAVAVPGGFLFIPANLLLAAQEEAEFAGMLAHSMAHVVARHGTRQATRGQLANLSTVPLIFMGGWTGRQNQSAQVPLGFLPYARQSEGEADRIGAETMAAAGFDPAALHRYLARTQQDPAVIARSALPARDERLGAIQATIAALPARTYSTSAYFVHAQNELRSLRPPPRPPSLRRP